ncbi:glycine zipper family protein [Gordonia sp. NPDC003376]
MLFVGISLVIPLSDAGRAQAGSPPDPVGWTVSRTGAQVTVELTHGAFRQTGNSLSLLDDSGTAVARLPLTYRLEYGEFPIAVSISGDSATLTPSRNPARARALDPTQVDAVRWAAKKQSSPPRTRQERDDQALARFNQQLMAGMTVSTIVGIVLGVVIGAIVGCIPGLALAGVGCIPGLALGATVGSIVGTVLGGGGSLIVAAWQYFQTINSPFVPPPR